MTPEPGLLFYTVSQNKTTAQSFWWPGQYYVSWF